MAINSRILIDSMYEKLAEIGRGTSGSVYLVKNDKGSIFALKGIDISK